MVTGVLAGSRAMLEGKVVLVAGVGPGLGQALARRCATAGADLVLVARDGDRLTATADEVEELGRTALAVATDLTDDASVQELVDASLAAFGHVDGMVYNAMTPPAATHLVDTDPAEIRQSVDVDAFAALRLARPLAATLAERRGSIVTVNASVLRHARQACGSYKIAKAALHALTRCLSTELGPLGVRVNAVAPGPIAVDVVKQYIGYLAEENGQTAGEVYDRITSAIDRRDLPDADAVADTIVFMMSDLARAVTGQCLDVNGGEYHN